MYNIITKINEFDDTINKQLSRSIYNTIIKKIQYKFPFIKLDIDISYFNMKSTSNYIYFDKELSLDMIEKVKNYLNKYQTDFNRKNTHIGYVINTRVSPTSICLWIKHLTGRIKPKRFIRHQTDISNIPSIIRNGLKVQEFSNGNYKYESDLFYPPAIFLSNNIDHSFYGRNSNKVFIEIDTNLLDKSHRFYVDFNMSNRLNYAYSRTNYIVTYQDIPPTAITNIYAPDGETPLEFNEDGITVNEK